jgi:hypothetical protein
LFTKLKAKLEMFPVMNRDDLQKGMQQLGGRREQGVHAGAMR